MAAAIIEQAEAGERLRLTVDRAGERVHVSLSRPLALQSQSEGELFTAQLTTVADFAAGFPLRLARGLARIAGVEVGVEKAAIVLRFAGG